MPAESDTEMLGVRVAEGVVLPEWIDVNGHMNVAYYVLAFDLGVDALWEGFGITTDYIEQAAGSTFAVECHITYQQELVEGDRYLVTSQILGYDDKRIHQFQRLYHAQQEYLAATAEWMNLHVDLAARRVCPWPASILAKLEDYVAGLPEQAYPAEAGKQMKIASPVYALQKDR